MIQSGTVIQNKHKNDSSNNDDDHHTEKSVDTEDKQK